MKKIQPIVHLGDSFPQSFYITTYGGTDLKLPLTQWPVVTDADDGELCTTICNLVITEEPIDRFSSFDRYKRVTACDSSITSRQRLKVFNPRAVIYLTTQELLYSVIQTADKISETSDFEQDMFS